MKAMVASASDGDIADIAAYSASLACGAAVGAAGQAAVVREAGVTVCTSCHGANGISADHAAPNLVGQSADYLMNALKSYANGTRSHAVMSALIKGASEAEVGKTAAYYARSTCK